MTPPPIIESRGLTRTFTVGKTTVEAVADLTFDVAPGELVAFLGPNGAGKSTSLRMLTTLLQPTAGSARVAGADIATQAATVRAGVGYVGQLTSGGHAQRARDELLSQGAFYGMSRAAAAKRADELIEALDLSTFASRGVQQLSGGQKRRLDVAIGLMHAPKLLFLDEPSTGLDPQSRANLWDHILRLRVDHGTTIFLTTHYLEEADRFAERVMIIDKGHIIADDTATRLKATLAGDVVTFGFDSADDASRAVGIVRTLTDRAVATAGDTSVQVTAPDGDQLLPAAIRALDAAGLVVRRATGIPPTLDDVFLALTGRTLREAGEGSPEEAETNQSTPTTETTVTDADAAVTEGALR
jgi:ABC-2 type transport system ATP-binding protein